VILERCKASAERQFYLERTKQFGWTKNVLIHQIENKTYEKTLLNQTNFDIALPEHVRNQATLALKDEYTFDFLELGDEHSERQLEQAILAKVEPFLLEMGGMFSFVGIAVEGGLQAAWAFKHARCAGLKPRAGSNPPSFAAPQDTPGTKILVAFRITV
jgi:predicted nuclease of restriction endonuclease-like (RecB) superfamily